MSIDEKSMQKAWAAFLVSGKPLSVHMIRELFAAYEAAKAEQPREPSAENPTGAQETGAAHTGAPVGLSEVERVAIAICPWHDGSHDATVDWKYMPEVVKDSYRAQAKAAIHAIKREAAPPDELPRINVPEIIDKLTSRICAWNATGLRRKAREEAMDYVEYVLSEIRYGSPKREIVEPVELRRFLMHHPMKHTLYRDAGLPLVDMLTPRGATNISLGTEEVDDLAESLMEQFDIRRRGSDV